MSGEVLVGGVVKARRRRRAPGAQEAPPVIGLRFVLIAALLAGTLAGLGVWHVHTVFTMRDDEMETRRLQDLAQKRHDRRKALESKISGLQRVDVLKAAAIDSLGMNAPAPQQMDTLIVTRVEQARWDDAAAEVRGNNTQKKEEPANVTSEP